MISLKLAVLCMTIVLINGQSGFHRSPSRCANEDCDFTLYWNNRGDQTVFTFTARTFLDDFVWAGFALSDDQRMVIKHKPLRKFLSVNFLSFIKSPIGT